MESYHCPSCGRITGHKRALGWGTFFAVVLTGGFWLLALPFYPMRCIICGYSRIDQKKAGDYTFLHCQRKNRQHAAFCGHCGTAL